MRVVIHIDQHGSHNYMADAELEFFIIDEQCPRDRVFQLSNYQVPAETITDLIGNSRIGRLGDMPGVEDEVRALVNGEPKPKGPNLTVVDP